VHASVSIEGSLLCDLPEKIASWKRGADETFLQETRFFGETRYGTPDCVSSQNWKANLLIRINKDYLSQFQNYWFNAVPAKFGPRYPKNLPSFFGYFSSSRYRLAHATVEIFSGRAMEVMLALSSLTSPPKKTGLSK
jgi:hypothetical protein